MATNKGDGQYLDFAVAVQEDWANQIKFNRTREPTFAEKLKATYLEAIWLVLFFIGMFLAMYSTFSYYFYERVRLWTVLGGQLISARVAAAGLRFCFAFILFAVAHRSTNFIRRILKNEWLPWHRWKFFHIMMGYVILILSIIHIGSHIRNLRVISGAPGPILACVLELPEANGSPQNGTDDIYHADCCLPVVGLNLMEDCCPVTEDLGNGTFVCAVGAETNGFMPIPSPINTTVFGFGEPVLGFTPDRPGVYSETFLHLQAIWGWTGWLITLLLFTLILTASKPIRERHFELFFNVHHFYPVIYILLCIHGIGRLVQPEEAYQYLIPIMVIYTAEKMFSIYKRRQKNVIKKAELYPSKYGVATKLVFDKPYGFSFREGEWVWVLIPEISQYEWHPVAICAGTTEDTIAVLFQALGDWSAAMYQLFQPSLQGLNVGDRPAHVILRLNEADETAARASQGARVSNPAFQHERANQQLQFMTPNLDDADLEGDARGPEVQAMFEICRESGMQDPMGAARLLVQNGIMSTRLYEYTERDLSFMRPGDLRALLKHIRAGTNHETPMVFVDKPIAHIYVDGGYGTYGDGAFQFKSLMLIGAGVGVTPMISLLKTLAAEVKGGRRHAVEKVRFYWTVRDRSMIQWVRREIVEVRRDLKEMLEVRLFETRNNQQLEKIALDHELNIFSGRIPIDDMFTDFRQSETERRGAGKIQIGVHATGPPIVTETLRYACVQNSVPDCKFVWRRMK